MKNTLYVISQGRSNLITERTEVFSDPESSKARYEAILKSKQSSGDFSLALYVLRTPPYDPTQPDTIGVGNIVTDAVDDMFEGCTLLAMRVMYDHERMSSVQSIGGTEVFGFTAPTPTGH